MDDKIAPAVTPIEWLTWRMARHRDERSDVSSQTAGGMPPDLPPDLPPDARSAHPARPIRRDRGYVAAMCHNSHDAQVRII
jgi:hypothetical protein